MQKKTNSLQGRKRNFDIYLTHTFLQSTFCLSLLVQLIFGNNLKRLTGEKSIFEKVISYLSLPL